MSKSFFLKFFLPLLFILALALGFIQRARNSQYPLKLQLKNKQSNIAPDKSLSDYYQEAQSLAPKDAQPATTSVSFLAVGDIMLSRNVAVNINNSKDVSYPFGNAADLLKSTDFNFANLESPVAAKNPIIGGHSLIFGAASSSLAGLKNYNFQIVNLANNHAFDQGLAGVDITRSAFDNLGIAHEGTGDNLDEAWTPAVVTANGLKICFIGASFSSLNDGGKVTNNYVARIEDTERLKQAITTAKSECDFTVVTMHAGIEYTRAPNTAQVKFAHTAIDDGADIVIGAHPHWVQTVEKYNGKYIFYSLGNFIFDQNFSQDTMEGLTLKVTITKSGCSVLFESELSGLLPQSRRPIYGLPGDAEAGKSARYNCASLQGPRQPATLTSIELLPVIIQNSQPRVATDAEAKKILDKINQEESVIKP